VDVSFYGVEKSEKYNQVSAGSPILGSGNPYRFEAIVAPSSAGSVQSATVTATGGTPQALALDPVTGWDTFLAKFPSQSALDSAAPSGNYSLVVNTLSQGQKTLVLSLPQETFPSAPHISNWAAGQAIDPAASFTLQWDPVAGATTNDVFFLLIGDAASGESVFRSADPFQPGALNGTATSVVLPTGGLHPATVYQAQITFFKVRSVDTTSYPGVAGVVGFGSETDFGLMTTASPVPPEISAVGYSASGFVLRLTGQTGRGYIIQYSSDLAHWTDLVNTNISSTTIELVDPQAASSSVRFYRAATVN
ncbi:MAG: hypothetical protein ACREIC_17545, partial [Limisphaerales bacterium]